MGKTELAKALAGALFADEKMMVRIDMSEYMEVNIFPSVAYNPGEKRSSADSYPSFSDPCHTRTFSLC